MKRFAAIYDEAAGRKGEALESLIVEHIAKTPAELAGVLALSTGPEGPGR